MLAAYDIDGRVRRHRRRGVVNFITTVVRAMVTMVVFAVAVAIAAIIVIASIVVVPFALLLCLLPDAADNK